jgi:hypothetical protein
MSRVLLVTIRLNARTGTEVVCAETAHALRKRNHAVSIYTQQDGSTAESLRAEGFEVVTDLTALGSVPEVIQASQTYPLVEAVARFPDVPAISVCHDATVWFNEPIDLPSIRRHVAVDLACRDRIASRLPHLAAPIEILGNAVDLDRFTVRTPLPARSHRALIVAKHSSFLDAVRAACSQRDIEVDAVGPGIGEEITNLSSRLSDYDLVFASARSALEALAAGCAVIVIDGRGLAGLVTQDNVAPWRENNFGLRILSRQCSADAILAEIDRYDAKDARAVCDYIRANASLDDHIARLEQLHHEVIADGHAIPIDNTSLPQLMARAFRALAEARERQIEGDFQNFAALRQRQVEIEFQNFAAARQRQVEVEFQNFAAARQRQVEVEFQEFASAREAQLRSEILAQLASSGAAHADIQTHRKAGGPRNLVRRIAHKLGRVLLNT